MYKTNFTIKPVVLYKEDLYNLERLLKNNVVIEKDKDFKIVVKFSNRELTINTFDELFSEDNLPKYNSDLSIFITSVKNSSDLASSIEKRIYIGFNEHNTDVAIEGENEVYVSGMERIIFDYFKRRKPWYSVIIKNIYWFLPLFSCMVAFISFKANLWITISLLTIIFGMIIVTYPPLLNKILPSVKINYFNRLDENGNGYTYKDLWGKIGVIVSIIGIIISIILKIV